MPKQNQSLPSVQPASHDAIPMPDFPPGYFIEINSNYSVHLVYFQKGTEWYVRLINNSYDTHDLHLTFGPYPQEQINQVVDTFRKGYYHIYEEWDGPFLQDVLMKQQKQEAKKARTQQKE